MANTFVVPLSLLFFYLPFCLFITRGFYLCVFAVLITSLQLPGRTETTIDMSWALTTTSTVIDSYRIKVYNEKWSFKHELNNIDKSLTSYTIPNLEPGYIYWFSINPKEGYYNMGREYVRGITSKFNNVSSFVKM